MKKLQNAQFGKKSERLDHDQLQLAMEDLETAAAKQDAEEEKKQAAETPAKPRTETQKKRRPNRGSLPAHLPRIHVTIGPESTVCPCCQGQMHMITDGTSERLDSIPAQHRVVVTLWGAKSSSAGFSLTTIGTLPSSTTAIEERAGRPTLKGGRFDFQREPLPWSAVSAEERFCSATALGCQSAVSRFVHRDSLGWPSSNLGAS